MQFSMGAECTHCNQVCFHSHAHCVHLRAGTLLCTRLYPQHLKQPHIQQALCSQLPNKPAEMHRDHAGRNTLKRRQFLPCHGLWENEVVIISLFFLTFKQ